MLRLRKEVWAEAEGVGLAAFARELELPLMRVLEKMERAGVMIDLTALAEISGPVRFVLPHRILSKPWNLGELTTVVNQAVEQFRLMAENRRLADELHKRNQHLEVAVIERTNGLLDGMVRALDYRDTETQWHSRKGIALCEAIGRQGRHQQQTTGE